MSQGGDPSTAPVVYMGVVGTIITVVVILSVQALYYRGQSAENQRKMDGPSTTTLVDSQTQPGGYRWIDREKGVVGIPVERAMELTIKEHQAAPATQPAGATP